MILAIKAARGNHSPDTFTASHIAPNFFDGFAILIIFRAMPSTITKMKYHTKLSPIVADKEQLSDTNPAIVKNEKTLLFIIYVAYIITGIPIKLMASQIIFGSIWVILCIRIPTKGSITMPVPTNT